MNEPLHPSTLSEILDRTAQMYRSKFLVFFGIAVIPTATLLIFAGAVALAALRWGAQAGADDSGTVAALLIAGFFALGLVALPALVGTTALANAAMNHASARAYLGQEFTIRASYKSVWRRGWQYIGLLVMQFVAVWIIPFMAWFVLVMVSTFLSLAAQMGGFAGGGLVVVLIFLIVIGLACYAVWMSLRISLAFPACVVEQIGPWDALKRSSSLSKGTRGRILVLYLLGVVLNWILSIAVWLPLVIGMSLLPGFQNPQNQQTIGMITLFIVYGAGFAVQAFTRPVYGIALMLFYYDQRIRQEGFDIEWMMLNAGLVVPAPQAEPQPPAPPRAESWVEAVHQLSRAPEPASPADIPSRPVPEPELIPLPAYQPEPPPEPHSPASGENP